MNVLRHYFDAFRGLPREVWFLCGTLMINRAGAMVIVFQTLYLTEERGLSKTVAGWIVTAYAAGSALGAWTGGWFTDRVGSYRTQFVSMLAGGVLLLLFPIAMRDVANPLVLGAAFFALAVVADASRPAVMTGVAERAPIDRQARAFTLLRLAMSVGLAIAPAAGGLIAHHAGYTWLFVINGVASLAAAGWLLKTVSPVEAETGDTSERERASPARSPWRDGPFLALVGLVILVSLAFFQILVALPLYFRLEWGFDKEVIGWLLAFNSIIIIVAEMPLVRWAERRDHLMWFGLGCAVVCLGFGLMPFGSGVLYAAFTILIWTVGEMLCLPLSNSLVAERAPKGSRGAYMGVYAMAFSVAFIAAPVWAMPVYERISPDMVWYVIAAIAPVIVAGAWWLRRWWTVTSEGRGAAPQPTIESAG